jgi:hypothetical protein
MDKPFTFNYLHVGARELIFEFTCQFVFCSLLHQFHGILELSNSSHPLSIYSLFVDKNSQWTLALV